MGADRAPSASLPPTLGQIFFSFLRLGATAFGGPAMVAHIRVMAVQEKQWVDEDGFRKGVAFCQTIPGATAMQTSAYVGLRARGARGAAAGFIGFGLPSFLLMLVLSALYASFHSLPAVVSTCSGLQALIVALIAHAAFTFGRSYLKKWQDIVIAAVAAALFWAGLDPIFVVVLSFVLGTVLRSGERGAFVAPPTGQSSFPLKVIVLLLGLAVVGLAALFFLSRRLFELSLLMLRVDLFAFGGGFASIPIILHEVVEVRHWMDAKTFLDGIALGQVTPGPIVITATFVGFALEGVPGALVATASIFFPSFFLVLFVWPFFQHVDSLHLFRKGISGVLCSFVGLLAATSLKFGLALGWDLRRIVVAVGAFVALMLRVNLLYIVLGAVLLTLMLSFLG